MDTQGILNAIAVLPREAAKSNQYYELSGIGPDEAEGILPPYDEAIRDLERVRAQCGKALAAIRKLKGHKHDWNEDDYCSICGADGRA